MLVETVDLLALCVASVSLCLDFIYDKPCWLIIKSHLRATLVVKAFAIEGSSSMVYFSPTVKHGLLIVKVGRFSLIVFVSVVIN